MRTAPIYLAWREATKENILRESIIFYHLFCGDSYAPGCPCNRCAYGKSAFRAWNTYHNITTWDDPTTKCDCGDKLPSHMADFDPYQRTCLVDISPAEYLRRYDVKLRCFSCDHQLRAVGREWDSNAIARREARS